eukprot:3488167-Amphidinium_carterae.1
MFDGKIDDDDVTVNSPDFGSSGPGFGTAGEVEDNVSEDLTPTPSAVSSPSPKRVRLDPQVTLCHVALERLQAA